MECYNHPDREAVTTCSVCGKAVCQECSMEIAGNVYCKDCVNQIVAQSMMEKTNNKAPQDTLEANVEEEIIEEPVETITPLKQEEVEEIIPAAPEKPAENYEPEYEYETEYVETYDDDGMEDSYYEDPEIIPEPEPEYKERERVLKKQAAEEEIIEPIHKNAKEEFIDSMEADFYDEEPSETPSNELEAKYEKYLEDLYYDEEEELGEEVYEAPKTQKRSKPRAPQRDDVYYDEDHKTSPRNYSNQGEYYINPREDEFEDEYITPKQGRKEIQNQEAESYEELKRRIERNYAKEQEAKQNRRFRRSKKSKKAKKPKKQKRPDYEYDELENIQEMHGFPEEYEEDKIGIIDIILAIILILLIILLILYVIYLFRLNGEYFSFLDSLLGLTQDPASYLSNVLNFL